MNDSTVKKIADALSVEADAKPSSKQKKAILAAMKSGDFEPEQRISWKISWHGSLKITHRSMSFVNRMERSCRICLPVIK